MRTPAVALFLVMALTTACAKEPEKAPTATPTVSPADAKAEPPPPPAAPPDAQAAAAPPAADAATAAPPKSPTPTTAPPPAKPTTTKPKPATEKPATTKPEPPKPEPPKPEPPKPEPPKPEPAAPPASGGVTPEIKTLWSKKCGSCHGADGQARGTMGQKMAIESMASSEWQKRFSDAEIKKATTEGVTREKNGVSQKMKPYSLTPAELDGLVALIRSFK